MGKKKDEKVSGMLYEGEKGVCNIRGWKSGFGFLLSFLAK